MATEVSDSTAPTVEIHEGVFCQGHLKEVCTDCDFDGREENDAFFGFDPATREPLTVPSNVAPNKDGIYQCKKHSNTECTQCFGWKKQIGRLQKEAKKAGRNNQKTTNLY